MFKDSPEGQTHSFSPLQAHIYSLEKDWLKKFNEGIWSVHDVKDIDGEYLPWTEVTKKFFLSSHQKTLILLIKEIKKIDMEALSTGGFRRAVLGLLKSCSDLLPKGKLSTG